MNHFHLLFQQIEFIKFFFYLTQIISTNEKNNKIDSNIYRDYMYSITPSKLYRIDIVRWVITLLIGFFTAAIAFFLDVIIRSISAYKFKLINLCKKKNHKQKKKKNFVKIFEKKN